MAVVALSGLRHSQRAAARRDALAKEVGATLRREPLPAFDQFAQVALTFAREGVESASPASPLPLHVPPPVCRAPPDRAAAAPHVCWR